MDIATRIAKALAPDLITQEEIKVQIEEVKAQMARRPVIADNEDYGWRKVSGYGTQDPSRREFPYISYPVMIELANYMYVMSGLTRRIISDTANFVLGEGVEYKVSEDDDWEAKEILDEFWDDSRNNMDIDLDSRIQSFCLMGELCWPVDVSRNGRVWMSYMDTARIVDVETVMHFPMVPSIVKISDNTRMDNSLFVIREDVDPMSKTNGRLRGECFYFAINKMPNMPRGYSDLTAQFDFIENYESGLFDELDRTKFLKNFVWDVLVKGADEETIKNFQKVWGDPPKPGTVRFHNEEVEWNAVAPAMQAGDNKAMWDLFKTYLSSVINRPDSWFGSGGKAYQTEAELMGEPSYKQLKKRQKLVKYILEYVLRFVLDQAIIAGRIKDKGQKITVIMPEMSAKDTGKAVASMSHLLNSLTMAMSKGLLTRETAAEFFAFMAGQTGFEIDHEHELANAKTEADQQKDEDEADYREKEEGETEE